MELQQRLSSRSLTKVDLYVMSLALFVLMIILTILLNDRLFYKIGFQTLGNHQKIAVTSHSIKDVRRRVDTDVMWLPLYNTDDVYESDAIYTGKDSETEITLDDGIRLQLEPDSLIVVHRDQIELQQGKLWSSFDQPQKIKIITPYGQSEISGKKGKFKIEASQVGTPVTVTDGEITLENETGRSVLKKQEIIPPKFLFTELSPPTVFFPSDGASIELKAEEMTPISFQWQSLERTPKYKIQISSDSDFKNIVRENEVSDLSLASKPFSAGTYFWRVQGVSQSVVSNWSKVSTFKISKYQPPLQTVPEEPAEKSPEAPPQPAPGPLRAPKLKSKHQTYKFESFNQIHPQSIVDKILSLILPSAHAESAQSAEQGSEQSDAPKLDWEKVPGAAAYEVEVAKDKNFKKIFVKKTVTENTVKWNSHKPGTFYWHVRGIDKGGNAGDFSEVSSIDLILLPPKVHPPVPVVGTENKMKFSWNRVPFAKGYEFQFSNDSSFSKPITLSTKTNSIMAIVPSDAKFWRVRAITGHTKFDGRFSAIQPISRQEVKVSAHEKATQLILKPLGQRPGFPILFDPSDYGIEMSALQFDYEVTEKNEVRIGEMYLDGEAIGLSIINKIKPTFVFVWPQEILDSGKILLQTADGKQTIMAMEFSPSDLTSLGGNVRLEKAFSQNDLKKLGSGLELRFCAERTLKTFKSSICSKIYRCETDTLTCVPRKVEGPAQVTMKVNGLSAPSKDIKTVKPEEKIVFDSTGTNGSNFHLETQPLPFQIRDVVMQDEDTVVLSGNGSTPYAKALEKDGFNWRTPMLLRKPTIYFTGENGIVFREDLMIKGKLPYEKNRGYINFKSQTSTYLDEVKLLGLFENPNHKVSSTQREAHVISAKEFEWYFLTPEKGTANTDRVTLLGDGEDHFIGRYSVYRGYQYEAAGRFTAAYTDTNKPLVLGELSASTWFEKIFKSDNYKFSIQRWGVTASYFNTLLSATNAAGTSVTISGYNADLKYRLRPGFENQDETFGLLMGYQNLTYIGALGNMLGIGGFWTKPMPSFVDKFFNYVKWFRYPKVLDVELTYYPLSTTSGMTLGTNLNAVFRGKIFVKPNFFLDGGLGVKNFDYTQANQYHVQAGLLFLTIGAGLDF